MKEAFRALLTGSPAVTALVPASRINWRKHPQGLPWPGIVLHLINRSPGYTVADVVDVADVRVQVNCVAPTVAQAEAISDAVETLLSNYQGGAFYQIRLAGKRDIRPDTAPEIGDPAAVAMDFTFQHRRT